MTRAIRRRSRIDNANETHSDSVDETPPPDSAADTAGPEADAAEPQAKSAPGRLRRLVVFGLLPGLAMLIAGGAGYLKWLDTTARETQSARIESVQAATESTIKILSYSPDSVDHDLNAARDRLTGKFRDAYTQLTHDVVIPGSKEKKISSVATVPAATSVSASSSHAVVMVFVNQTIMVGNDPPSSTSSTLRVTMDKRDNRWLISDFTPI
jgi:Mce-associated membrane protein